MPQSLANVLLHVVFSTKHREPFLATHELREAMEGYLVGTLTNQGCPSLIVGAMPDHIHILCQLSRTITIANLLPG
jgi:REP element-mobilizing transposase RayT